MQQNELKLGEATYAEVGGGTSGYMDIPAAAAAAGSVQGAAGYMDVAPYVDDSGEEDV